MLRALVLFLELPLYCRLRTAAVDVKILRSLLSLKLEVGQVVVDYIYSPGCCCVAEVWSGSQVHKHRAAGDPGEGDQANLAVLSFGGPD